MKENNFDWRKRLTSVVVAMCVFVPMVLTDAVGHSELATRSACCAILMAYLWVSETLPLAVTALLPMILHPLLGISSANETAKSYFNEIQFLFFGSFLTAKAMEKCNLLTRIALKTLLLFRSPRKLLLCSMLLTWFMSAWMSNVAVVAVVFPMMQSILERLKQKPSSNNSNNNNNDDDNSSKDREHAELVDRYSTASLIAVAYCASIGGIATPVGTGPNLIFLGMFRQMFPSAVEIGFGSWLLFAMPVSFLITIVLWLYLSFVHCRGVSSLQVSLVTIESRLVALGTLSKTEIIVAALFIVQAILWLTRGSGDGYFGWATLFVSKNGFISDSTVAIFIAILLFSVPIVATKRNSTVQQSNRTTNNADEENDIRMRLLTKTDDVRNNSTIVDHNDDNDADQNDEHIDSQFTTTTKQSKNVEVDDASEFKWTPILNEHDINTLPWNILILLGGGFAMADSMAKSGLIEILSNAIGDHLRTLGIFWVLVIVLVVVTAMTELTSNVATANVVLPIIGSLAVCLNVDPTLLMLPATMCCSFAFMLPISTPPNAVAFSSGVVRLRHMIQIGILLNIFCIFFVAVAMIVFGRVIFNIEDSPAWLRSYNCSSIRSNNVTTSTSTSTSTSAMMNAMTQR